MTHRGNCIGAHDTMLVHALANEANFENRSTTQSVSTTLILGPAINPYLGDQKLICSQTKGA